MLDSSLTACVCIGKIASECPAENNHTHQVSWNCGTHDTSYFFNFNRSCGFYEQMTDILKEYDAKINSINL